MSCSYWEWRAKAGLVMATVLWGVNDEPLTDMGAAGRRRAMLTLKCPRDVPKERERAVRSQGRPHPAA